MSNGRTKRELLILLAGLLAFGLVLMWGQAQATRSQAAQVGDSPMYAERTGGATGTTLPVDTYLAGNRPSYLDGWWNFRTYQTFTFGWYLSRNYSTLGTTKITLLTRDFGNWLAKAFPHSNRDYKSFVIVSHPEAITHVQTPAGGPSEILRGTPFSQPLVEFGRNFSSPKSYQKSVSGFLFYYDALPTASQPVTHEALTGIMRNYGGYINTRDDCVTINTAGARSDKGEQAAESESCALLCGGISITASGQTCGIGVCVATLGVTVASCANSTCGAGAITCGSAETCGSTCNSNQTCLAVSCAGESCNLATCNGQTCGLGATCGSVGATCGVANTCGSADTCGGACMGLH